MVGALAEGGGGGGGGGGKEDGGGAFFPTAMTLGLGLIGGVGGGGGGGGVGREVEDALVMLASLSTSFLTTERSNLLAMSF